MATQLTDQQVQKLIDEITQQVISRIEPGNLPTLNHEHDPDCCAHDDDGRCVKHCTDRVRSVINEGAGRISSTLGYIPSDLSMARLIDHTLLKPDATAEQIAELCREAREYHFASVCVNSAYVPLAADLLKGSDVAVCTVVGFPLGASPAEVKAYEAQLAIRNGANEIDMVMNIGAIKSRDLKALYTDIATVVATCHAHNILCKVILETTMLTDEEKVMACQVCKMAGADFVKTSTGFGGGGATVADVTLMRKVVGAEIGVKASGGVRNIQDAKAMVAAGATRIGASAGVSIAKAERGETVAETSNKGY
jgi:deoxyribose-phosphate aldolase